MAIDRTNFNALVDDDGSGTKGSLWNKAAIDSVILTPVDNALQAQAELLQISTTGAVDNVALDTTKRVHILLFSGTADVTLSGTTTANAGDRLIVLSNNSQNVYMTFYQTGRSNLPFYFFPNSMTAGLPIAGSWRGRAEFVSAAGIWVSLHHEQGAPINVPFNAANFGCDVGSSWAVPAGNVQYMSYYIKGQHAYISCGANGPLGGAPSTKLILAWPFTFQRQDHHWFLAYGGNGNSPGYFNAEASGSNKIDLYTGVAGAAWQLGTVGAFFSSVPVLIQ